MLVCVCVCACACVPACSVSLCSLTESILVGAFFVARQGSKLEKKSSKQTHKLAGQGRLGLGIKGLMHSLDSKVAKQT